MAISRLCAAFRKTVINNQSNIARYYSPYVSRVENNILPPACFAKSGVYLAYPEACIKFAPRTLDIDFGSLTTNKSINEIPLSTIISIEEPSVQKPIQQDLPLIDKSFELPSVENVIEQLTESLIVTRRKKMKKHKRRKFRQRMDAERKKIRHRRNIAKEKAFQNELVAKIKEAEAFDVRAYINEKFAFIEKERIPKIYKGEILPEQMIKEFLQKDKEERERRRNKPRSTLD